MDIVLFPGESFKYAWACFNDFLFLLALFFNYTSHLSIVAVIVIAIYIFCFWIKVYGIGINSYFSHNLSLHNVYTVLKLDTIISVY